MRMYIMTKSKKNLLKILIFGGIFLLLASTIAIIATALNMEKNIALAVTLGWMFFITLAISMVMIILGFVLYFIYNKENISNYLNKIMNKSDK